MKVLKQLLATVVALSVLSVSALALDAQRQNDPPKPPPPKEGRDIPKSENKPPPQRPDNNQNQGRGGDNKRGKP